MQIKITAELPVPAEVKPEIGSVHEVLKSESIAGRGIMHTIAMGRGQVGVFENECEELGEALKSASSPQKDSSAIQQAAEDACKALDRTGWNPLLDSIEPSV